MSAQENRSPVEEGTLVGGKYRIGRLLGAGGMGVVVAAVHERLEQNVAVKFLRKEAAAEPEAVERFLREARAAAKLGSDHVVRVFDTGVSEQDVPYLVMERLDGVDLDQLVERRGALPVDEAVGYVLEALEAIAEAHAAGIVHRDLKPSNLFLSKRPTGGSRVKVLDFGISKLIGSHAAIDVGLTSTKTVMGSPGYMSPEQVRSSRNVDARTDVWSVGVILWELLTGASAFKGESLGDVFAKIREEDLPALRTLRPDVSPELESVVIRCVARDRAERFADGAALAAALRACSTISTTDRAYPELSGGAVRSDRQHLVEAETMPAPEVTAAEERPPLASSTRSTFTSPSTKQGARNKAVPAVVLACVVVAAFGVWRVARSDGGNAASGEANGTAAERASRDDGSADATSVLKPTVQAMPGASSPLADVSSAIGTPIAVVSVTPTVAQSAPQPNTTNKLPAATAAPSPVPTPDKSVKLPPKKDDLGI